MAREFSITFNKCHSGMFNNSQETSQKYNPGN